MFYLVCGSEDQRNRIISQLKENEVYAVFHYLSLHKSIFYKDKHDGRELPQSDRYSNCLLRLPLYYELKKDEIEKIIYILKRIV
jgi:dTDP-4-amino-4,6-dideoxygalactose transaminase